MSLKYQTSRNLAASYRRDQFFELRNLTDVRALVYETAHMNWESPAVDVIHFLAQKIEKLRVTHGNQEVEAVISVAHNEKKRGLFISESVKLQLVVSCHISQFGNIKDSKPRTA